MNNEEKLKTIEASGVLGLKNNILVKIEDLKLFVSVVGISDWQDRNIVLENTIHYALKAKWNTKKKMHRVTIDYPKKIIDGIEYSREWIAREKKAGNIK